MIPDVQGKVCATGDHFLDSLFDQDPTSDYYRYIFELLNFHRGSDTLFVELGVFAGRCTAHIASANPQGKVLAVDVEPKKEFYTILEKYGNISFEKGRSDSEEILNKVLDNSVDFCLFDTVHEYDVVKKETELWLPKIKVGGFMMYDDITLNDGMKKFWVELDQPKKQFPTLHWTGFGIAEKK